MLHPAPKDKPLVLTVSELNAQIKYLLESNYPMVWVKGEISNFRVPASGHYYFTLKDEQTQIKAVFFRPQHRNLRFTPESGLQVLCQARVSVYEPRGEYQLIVDVMEPQGLGSLQLAFEQLKKKLQGEGLFDAARKKALGACPTQIAVVTSGTGAAIQDILRIFQKSPYALSVTLFPVRVQGQEAAGEIAAAMETINRLADAFQWDLVIVGRGGGSIEDLWPFNEEVAARAVAASRVPTISAVGHEIDFTICDMVADWRAPTPTAAAEWVVSQLDRFERDLTACQDRLKSLLGQKIETARQHLKLLQSRLIDPRKRLADLRLFVDDRMERLQLALGRRLERRKMELSHCAEKLHAVHPLKTVQQLKLVVIQKSREIELHQEKILDNFRLRLQECSAKLDALSPLGVLSRGYSITFLLPEKSILRGSRQADPGRDVLVKLAKGSLECTVKNIVD